MFIEPCCQYKEACVLRDLNRFIVDAVVSSPKREGSDERGAFPKDLLANVKAIQQISVMQKLDVDFFTRRAQVQQDALVHLIAEHDVVANQDLAKDARYLAVHAQKDSAGIKALTIVATFFIPPTFVSSLFSMPLFDWDSDGAENHTGGTETWKRRLFVYLTVTGPLMLVTFSIWGLLVALQRRKQGKEFKQSRFILRCSTSPGSEVIALMSKRTQEMTVNGDSEALISRYST
ncbi:hypothetical protein PVAG01_08411 [Phlyctema vagabunda]|uniref:Uncharacterized protein n=1 Tax=Phlyctema vagabunda TaxID=108571 RepID=A0ABR4P9C3_9HELO